MKLKHEIYEILLGQSLYPLKPNGLDLQIEDAFATGSECEELYEGVYNANREICKKLGVEESREVENMIWNLDAIQKIIAMKMYEYGYQVAKMETLS